MPTPLQASQASAPVFPTARTATPPDAATALPTEVLESAVDKGELFIERMDEWRRARGWTHTEFAAYLGISREYWVKLRGHRKQLTLGVALRVIQERPELGFILGDPFRYFAERTRRRTPGVGRRRGEATPGGA